MRDVTDYSFDSGRNTTSRSVRKTNLPPQSPVKPPMVDGETAPAAPQSIGNAQPLAEDFASAAAKPAGTSTAALPRITLRLTPDEDALLRERAGNQSISAYVRECVFGEAAGKRQRKSYAPIKDHVALAQLLGLLGETHLANNLNQLAYHANCGNLDVDAKTLAQLDEMYAHVTAMRDQLIRTLGLIENV